MTNYLDELKDILRPHLSKYGLKILPRGRSQFSLVKGGTIVMTVRDAQETVELSYKEKKYSYDKWYTKPEHLAQTIINVLEAQEKPAE
ncbi:MAG: hypothetical protein F7B20_04955 [Aeropyrum sp.]|nr:hypothetical protein [Aeropyrum sp.]MCE4616736.1 hypothetical protein [Aeropyrum sp.]